MKLTEIARKSILSVFIGGDFYPDEKTKEKYSKIGATFVTLTENGELRGCIGSLEAYEPIWEDVKDNAISAAFDDSRFSPITKEEFDKIKIEVSVLSAPKKINFNSQDELLDKLDEKFGVILKKDNFNSTFLPQVWEEIKDKKEFMEQLSLKAGLDREAWKNAEIWFYEVEKFSE